MKKSHAQNLGVATSCVGDLSMSLAGEMGTELVTAEHVRAALHSAFPTATCRIAACVHAPVGGVCAERGVVSKEGFCVD